MLKWNRIEILQCRDFIFFIGHVGEGTLITFIILDIVYTALIPRHQNSSVSVGLAASGFSWLLHIYPFSPNSRTEADANLPLTIISGLIKIFLIVYS